MGVAPSVCQRVDHKHTRGVGMNRSVAAIFKNRSKNCFGQSYLCFALLLGAMMLILSFVSQQTVDAQVSKGSVSGSIVDSQGASVPDASIKIVNTATNETVTVTSGRARLFRFGLLSVGVVCF